MRSLFTGVTGITGLLVATLVCGATATLSGCLPKPKQAYSNEQLQQVDSLEEIMRVQAQTMDPQFAKIGQTRFSDDEIAALVGAGQRMQVSAEVVRKRFSPGRPAGFAELAAQFGSQAGELVTAAQAKDHAKVSTALSAIRDTCRHCHKEFR